MAEVAGTPTIEPSPGAGLEISTASPSMSSGGTAPKTDKPGLQQVLKSVFTTAMVIQDPPTAASASGVEQGGAEAAAQRKAELARKLRESMQGAESAPEGAGANQQSSQAVPDLTKAINTLKAAAATPGDPNSIPGAGQGLVSKPASLSDLPAAARRVGEFSEKATTLDLKNLDIPQVVLGGWGLGEKVWDFVSSPERKNLYPYLQRWFKSPPPAAQESQGSDAASPSVRPTLREPGRFARGMTKGQEFVNRSWDWLQKNIEAQSTKADTPPESQRSNAASSSENPTVREPREDFLVKAERLGDKAEGLGDKAFKYREARTPARPIESTSVKPTFRELSKYFVEKAEGLGDKAFKHREARTPARPVESIEIKADVVDAPNLNPAQAAAAAVAPKGSNTAQTTVITTSSVEIPNTPPDASSPNGGKTGKAIRAEPSVEALVEMYKEPTSTPHMLENHLGKVSVNSLGKSPVAAEPQVANTAPPATGALPEVKPGRILRGAKAGAQFAKVPGAFGVIDFVYADYDPNASYSFLPSWARSEESGWKGEDLGYVPAKVVEGVRSAVGAVPAAVGLHFLGKSQPALVNRLGRGFALADGFVTTHNMDLLNDQRPSAATNFVQNILPERAATHMAPVMEGVLSDSGKSLVTSVVMGGSAGGPMGALTMGVFNTVGQLGGTYTAVRNFDASLKESWTRLSVRQTVINSARGLKFDKNDIEKLKSSTDYADTQGLTRKLVDEWNSKKTLDKAAEDELRNVAIEASLMKLREQWVPQQQRQGVEGVIDRVFMDSKGTLRTEEEQFETFRKILNLVDARTLKGGRERTIGMTRRQGLATADDKAFHEQYFAPILQEVNELYKNGLKLDYTWEGQSDKAWEIHKNEVWWGVWSGGNPTYTQALPGNGQWSQLAKEVIAVAKTSSTPAQVREAISNHPVAKLIEEKLLHNDDSRGAEERLKKFKEIVHYWNLQDVTDQTKPLPRDEDPEQKNRLLPQEYSERFLKAYNLQGGGKDVLPSKIVPQS